MNIRTSMLTALTSVAVLAMMAQLPAEATTVATIDGCYDCMGFYDTPVLTIENTSGGTFTNVKMTLGVTTAENSGLVTLNNGITQTISLPNMPGGNTNVAWVTTQGASNTVAGDLFTYDYDDSRGGPGPCPANPINSGLCARVGNFYVQFSAVISGGAFNGQAVGATFSPAFNNTGTFIGWEGIDPVGLSENPLYDVHSGGCSLNCTSGGTLALINLGAPPPPPAPGPIVGAGLPGLITGFGGLLVWWRQRRRMAA
jgi:hypothetical protein